MSRAVLIAFLACAACATPARPSLPPSRPPSSAELQAGYYEAIDLGGAAAARLGYSKGELQLLEQVRPNYWRLRFGLAAKNGDRVLEVYFDGDRHEVVQTEEVVAHTVAR